MTSSVCLSVAEHGVTHRSEPVIEHGRPLADQMSAQLFMCTVIFAYMGKQRDNHPPEDASWVESPDQFMPVFSEEDERLLEDIDVVLSFLTKADVDARRRKIIWEDGQRLSITQSARRIHAAHPDLSLEQIEDSVIGWLEMEFAPETYSEEQLDELDRLTEKWVDSHQSAREKRRRTPDS
jgi:hypothetical protein